MTLNDLPSLKKVIAHYGLAATKSLGQHFLLDLNVTRRIVRLAGDLDGVHVIEVGPGPGGLTRAILESKAKNLVAIEMDARCVLALQDLEQASEKRLSIIEGDAQKIDYKIIAPAPRALIANLPYNIGTSLLTGWLKEIELFQSLTLMFQAEVVDRITAKPNTKSYGYLSILAQSRCLCKKVMALPAGAFTPPPKVDSAVVHMTPKENWKSVPYAALEKIASAAFGQRRKMLRSSLKSLGGEDLLALANIPPTARAEDLTVDTFIDLAKKLKPSS